MNYMNDPQLLASLADAYVVGTLSGRARRRFERLCESQSSARTALRIAEDRLVGLSLALEPIDPAAATWSRILARLDGQRIDGRSNASTRRGLPASNRWRMAIAAGIAMVALGIGWLLVQQSARPTALASVAAEGGAQLWSLQVFGDNDRLRARVTGAVVPEPARSYELWALPEGGAPVSLGLLPETGKVDRDLTQVQRAAMRRSTKVAVSLEPAGGSQTGAPTGPVLYVAQLQVQST
jgi:anti-sigma-K factor RskA